MGPTLFHQFGEPWLATTSGIGSKMHIIGHSHFNVSTFIGKWIDDLVQNFVHDHGKGKDIDFGCVLLAQCHFGCL